MQHSSRTHHPEVHGRDVNIGGQLLEGVGDETRLDGFDPPNSRSRLHGKRSHTSDPVTTMGGDGLYISCHPCSR